MQRERALDTDRIADLTDRDVLGDSTVLAGNHDPFVNLNALLAALTDLDVRPDGISGPNRGKVLFQVIRDDAL